MAYINATFECSGKTKKNIRVPSGQGGSDRTIYVDGSDSGHRLGNSDDKVYNKRSGNLTANNLQDFAKNCLWYIFLKKLVHCTGFLFLNTEKYWQIIILRII